jgi:hypothetical protein
VAIDKAGRHDMAFGIDYLARRVVDAPDFGDMPVDNADVSLIARQSRTVDYSSVTYNQIVLHGILLSPGALAPRLLRHGADASLLFV